MKTFDFYWGPEICKLFNLKATPTVFSPRLQKSTKIKTISQGYPSLIRIKLYRKFVSNIILMLSSVINKKSRMKLNNGPRRISKSYLTATFIFKHIGFKNLSWQSWEKLFYQLPIKYDFFHHLFQTKRDSLLTEITFIHF